ncbi:hypothetical protein LTR62_000997 [Meristemomyces frigidus]|uniref:Uncharacterized protein n=1 Tax=Meristemomyces frigidus TaxID=1508187 RepID=A0AAN7T8S5_9PEZI|nr:hypothetical protein LTR62_000997 [Meristemomyces frigidus]
MAPRTPIVLEHTTLEQTLAYILSNAAAPTTIVFAGLKNDLFAQLSPPPDPEGTDSPASPTHCPSSAWAVPTLKLLASSRGIKMVFCPDITHLRAYLGTNQHQPDRNDEMCQHGGSQERILALINPIALHRPTSTFSAQGLNRTFAAAVEAAFRSKAKLVIAECNPSSSGAATDVSGEDSEVGERSPNVPAPDLWDEEVSILNVTTKSFGIGGRGWVGRTVKLRAVAGRWCVFQTLAELVE